MAFLRLYKDCLWMYVLRAAKEKEFSPLIGLSIKPTDGVFPRFLHRHNREPSSNGAGLELKTLRVIYRMDQTKKKEISKSNWLI